MLKMFNFTPCFAVFFSAENINFFTRVGINPEGGLIQAWIEIAHGVKIRAQNPF
jgi:hypothetical protein